VSAGWSVVQLIVAPVGRIEDTVTAETAGGTGSVNTPSGEVLVSTAVDRTRK
jgi:hypothetical protein